MDEIRWPHFVVGLFGVAFIINMVIIIISPKYFAFLSKGFFVEPLTNDQKDAFNRFVKKNKGLDRLTTSMASLGLAIIAILWFLGVIKSVTPLFFLLAALLLLTNYFYPKK